MWPPGGDAQAALSRTAPEAAAGSAPGRIPPQSTVTAAPDNTSGPVPGNEADSPALNGSVRRPSTPETPAQVPVPRAVVSAPARAGVVTRCLAAAVDAVAIACIAVLLDLGAAGARFLWRPSSFQWPHLTVLSSTTVLLVLAVVYLTVGWALAGRTYGARLMGLRVLSSRLELLGWARSLLRALTCVIWPVGLLWCGISRTRRSLADLLLRSVVVYDDRPYVPVPGGS